ncbi:hypothetical protein C4G51_RS18665 [Vibrio parahaemolyticus]|nr:hypothetical protein [Vibrio parahaemolyticus]
MSNFNGMPIETPEAIRVWASKRRDNEAIRLVAFSRSEKEFKELAKRYGWGRAWRNNVWTVFNQYVNQPDMVNVPYFTTGDWKDNVPFVPDVDVWK